MKCIDHFWKDVTAIDKSKLTLDADELLMIFQFITMRTKIVELFAHLKFINEFQTDTLRHSKLGYYCSTLEVALDMNLTLEQDKLQAINIQRMSNANDLIKENLRASFLTDYPLDIENEFDVINMIREQERDDSISRRMVFDS